MILLSARIKELITIVGAVPQPELNMGALKSEIISLSNDAKTLEGGQSAAKLKAKIAGLEIALEKSNAERQKLQVELEVANAEIKALSKVQDALPEIEERILVALKFPGGTPIHIYRIAESLMLDADVIAYHINRLSKSGHVHKSVSGFDAEVWTRSEAGNAYVYALRLSGDEARLIKMEKRNPSGGRYN